MIRLACIALFLTAVLGLSGAATVLAAGSGQVAVSATVLSRNTCQFRPPRTTVLDFGNLDPTNPVPVAASATFNFRCGGSSPLATFLISADNGLYFGGGSRQMQNAADPTAYIPYALTLSPQSATVPKNVDQILTISGSIDGADYRNASAGSYADQVVLAINP